MTDSHRFCGCVAATQSYGQISVILWHFEIELRRDKWIFPPHIIDAVREMHASASEESRILKAKLDEAIRIETLWNEYLNFVNKGWVMHLLALLDKSTATLKNMQIEGHPTVAAIEEAYRIAKEESERIIRRYPAFLEEACRKANLPLDADSPHPRYTLANRFFQLEIDDRKKTARLSDNEGRVAELPADIDPVVETIVREHRRVFDRPFDGKKVLKRLRMQYKAILKQQNQQDGASIPIRHVTHRLGKNVKGFRTDEFLVDLSRLAEKGPLEIDGRRLDLQQTKDTNQGMLLYGAAGRGYIGFIVFKEV